MMSRNSHKKTLCIFSSWSQVPKDLHTPRQWKQLGRKVRKGEQPAGVFQWQEWATVESERQETDGTRTTWQRKTPVIKQCGLYDEEQTAPYRSSIATEAKSVLWQYFGRFTSREHHISWWREQGRWLSCDGPLQEQHLREHLSGKARYGVRGGKFTRFGAIDLDLHNGDAGVFLEQWRVLLQEFHGKEGWHFQVANENAGGVHLFQAFRAPILLARYRQALRQRLRRLDEEYPELAAKARQVAMKSLGELEIYPDTQRGLRLPLCEGRTMLLDQPLELVFDQRRKRAIQDVVGYVSWLIMDNKAYMPAQDIVHYVQQRLKQTVPARTIKAGKPQTRRENAPGALGSLGRMKGRYAKVLVDFWSGNMKEPDTLNIAIRLLALPLPYYKNEDEAVELIESYVDELPDNSLSDRLSSGNRAEVSRVIKNTVRQLYAGNDGQPEPVKSRKIIQATVDAWRKRGFDPTDKTTWSKMKSRAFPLAKDFCWKGTEVLKLGVIQKLLNCSLHTASELLKYFLRLVKAHQGEIAVSFVQRLLERFGISCGHHGKANQFLALLRQWDWIRVTAWESWHLRDQDGEARKGRARTYVIGEALQDKFAEVGGGDRSVRRVLSLHPREQRDKDSIITSHCSWLDPFTGLTSDTTRNKGSPDSWSWRRSQDQGRKGMVFSYAQD